VAKRHGEGFRVKYVISLILVLTGIWLLWSGIYEPLLLGLGAVSVLTVVGLCFRMGLIDAEGAPFELLPRALLYAPWLLWEIFKANLDVARRILSPGLPISPRMIEVEAGQRTDLGLTIYANSITLTPGTVSVGVDGDRRTIRVHALTAEAAEGVESGVMDRRVTRVEGRP